MPPSLSLRTRLFGGILAVLLAATVGLAFVVDRFIEALEVALIDEQLNDRMAGFAADYAADPRTSGPQSPRLRAFVDGEERPSLPAWLASLDAGIHEDVPGDGKTWYVARQDVNGAALFLALDIEPLERLEAKFVAGALLAVGLAVALAAAAAWWLSLAILAPVSRLASRVLLLDPGTRGSRVGEVSGDFEVSLIATAFDRYLDQLDAFVIREQAFTGDVSHELRTPLATVLSAAQLLLADPDLTAVVRTRVLRIERAAQRMHELAEAMLFLARERRPGGTQVCALEQVLQDVVDSYRDAALRRGLELRLKIQCTGMVVAPPGMVTSVIGNLIGNAVDHAGRGVVEVELGRHVLTVRDEGPGIAAGDASHMFERGYKGSDSRGFGLGLALVKRICDHLGWALEIDSATGRGTIVSVRFAEVG